MEVKPKASKSPLQRVGARRAMLGVLLFVNLFVIGMTAVTLRQNRRHAEETASITAKNLTLVLERDLLGDIQKIDLALFTLRQEMLHQMSTGGLREAELNTFIARVFTQFPELSSIRTANAQGRIDHGIGVLPGTNFSVADRAYFAEARSNPNAGLMISEPVMGKISGQWVVILARRVDRPDGSFAGVAYAAITLDQFTRALSLITLGPSGTVTLRNSELSVLAKYPAIRSLGPVVGRREVSPTFQELLHQNQTSGLYQARGGLDGIERIYSFKKLGSHPLYIHVGLASVDYLAQWRAEARKHGLFAGLFMLITFGLAWLLLRAWRREQERVMEEVRELRGMIPICATCKKIRDDEGYWNQLEAYVQAHSAAHFTHGICPECAGKMLAEIHSTYPH